MERAIEVLAAIQFLVIGLSHIAHPHAWVEFFEWLRSKGHTGAFLNGMLSLSIGPLIVAFHNVWTGLPAVLTVLGWAMVLKGLICLVFPQVALRSLARVSPSRSREVVVAGVALLALSAMCWYLVARQ